MNIIKKLFSKKKDVPPLEKYITHVDRVSKQADALHKKAVKSYSKQIKGGKQQ